MRAFCKRPGLLVAWALVNILWAAPVLAADGIPALTSVGAGWFDEDDFGINMLWFDQGNRAGTGETYSLWLDHRFGGDLALRLWPFLEMRPWLGTLITADGGFFGGAGGIADLRLGPVVLGVSAGAGLFLKGDGKDLGYPLEFRTGLEAGWVFDNDWRLTAAYYHLSNAEIRPDNNPGANSLVIYLHIPELAGYLR